MDGERRTERSPSYFTFRLSLHSDFYDALYLHLTGVAGHHDAEATLVAEECDAVGAATNIFERHFRLVAIIGEEEFVFSTPVLALPPEAEAVTFVIVGEEEFMLYIP